MEFGVHVLGIGLQASDAAAHQQVLDGSYSPSLVLASIGIAFFGSYVGLVISQQSQVARHGGAPSASVFPSARSGVASQLCIDRLSPCSCRSTSRGNEAKP